ncbi:hypothetical protein [Litoribacter populi]|uniref:hypothetical protein n=1 Tax=Litoribacter populi TaxID=2598460 RepID=UPI0011801BF6|nr:hypothetical protein [Litoribacter populi]
MLYYNGSFTLLPGNQLPLEGPLGVPNFINFWACGSTLYFLDNKSITIFNKYEDENKVLYFSELDFFGKSGIVAVSRGDGFNFNYPSFDCDSGNIFLAAKNVHSGLSGILQFNFRSNDFRLMEFQLDNEEIKKNTVSLPMGLGVINFPDVFLSRDNLVVSYAFKGNFHVYNRKYNSWRNYDHYAEQYPLAKNLPQEILPSYSNHQGMAILKDWQDDVSYGSFGQLGERYFFRVVKGRKHNEGVNLFLELFDITFRKVDEVNLTNLQPQLGTRWLVLENELFIFSKNQPKEDELAYYKVAIQKKNVND